MRVPPFIKGVEIDERMCKCGLPATVNHILFHCNRGTSWDGMKRLLGTTQQPTLKSLLIGDACGSKWKNVTFILSWTFAHGRWAEHWKDRGEEQQVQEKIAWERIKRDLFREMNWRWSRANEVSRSKEAEWLELKEMMRMFKRKDQN